MSQPLQWSEKIQTDDALPVTALEQEWQRILTTLRAELGEAAFRSWLQPLSVARIDDGAVSLAVPVGSPGTELEFAL